MDITLPDIDPANISSLSEAKEVLQVLMNSFENLVQLYVQQEAEIAQLQEENRQLKGQPKKPHFKSQALKNPTSSSVRKLLKEKGVWHKSNKKDQLEIDTHVNLPDVGNCSCGSLKFKTLRTSTKVIQGIIFQRNNVSYHGKDQQCLNCNKVYSFQTPDELKGVSFDPQLKSLISFFKYGCRMTHPLIQRMFLGLGIQISTGEISEILLGNGGQLTPTYQHLKAVGFKKSKYLQSDSTGAKRKLQGGKRGGSIIRNQYVQVISNPLLSVFAITRHYNIPTLTRLLTKTGRQKPYVSDDGSPNGDGLRCWCKQLCWVHEIRHYQKLFSFFNPYQKEKEQILASWSNFYQKAKAYGKNPTKQNRIEVEKLFDDITSKQTGYDLLNHQLKITKKKKGRLLTFLDYPFLPIHNNQCEQDLREFVIQRRISKETKSAQGDRALERHLSIIQTAQKQGLNVLQTLHGLLTGTLSPQVLTVNIS